MYAKTPIVVLALTLAGFVPCSAQEEALRDRPGDVLEALRNGSVGSLRNWVFPESVGRIGLEEPTAIAELVVRLRAEMDDDKVGELDFKRLETAGDGWLMGTIADVEGLGEDIGHVIVAEAPAPAGSGVTHVQFGGGRGPEDGEDGVQAIIDALVPARRMGDAEAWLTHWDADATVYSARIGECVDFVTYSAELRESFADAGEIESYDLAADAVLVRGNLALVSAGESSLNADPEPRLFVLVGDEEGHWRIVHMASLYPRKPVPIPKIPPASSTPVRAGGESGLNVPIPWIPAPPSTPKERIREVSASFHRIPVPATKSRRNRPCAQGDVVVWQDNVIRGTDYDIFAFYIPTRQLYLINAPAPESNQVFPALNDRAGYVVWTDDGTKLTNVDLYGIHLRKATLVPWDAPMKKGSNPAEILIGGKACRRPHSDALTALPGNQVHARMSGWSVVFTSREPNRGQCLRVGSLWRFPIKSVPLTDANAMPSCPDICGRWVVWQDHRNGNWDIYGCDLETAAEFAICAEPGDQILPRVDGDIVVWQDGRHDRLCRALSAVEVETPDGLFGDSPAATMGQIQDRDAPEVTPDWWVYAQHLPTGIEFPVSGCDGPAMEPDIDGPVIVWRERFLDQWDIYMMHLAVPVPIPVTFDKTPQYQPSVSRDTIAWAERIGEREQIGIVWWEPGAPQPGREGQTPPLASAGPCVAVPDGECYHRPWCSRLKRSDNPETVSPAEIARRGLRPCKVCKP